MVVDRKNQNALAIFSVGTAAKCYNKRCVDQVRSTEHNKDDSTKANKQNFSHRLVTKFVYQWCSAGALGARAPLAILFLGIFLFKAVYVARENSTGRVLTS